MKTLLLVVLLLTCAGCASTSASRVWEHARFKAASEGVDFSGLPAEEQSWRLEEAQAELAEEEMGDVLGFLPEPVRTPAKAGAGLLFYLLARRRSRQHIARAASSLVRGQIPTAVRALDAATGGRHSCEVVPETPAPAGP